MGQALYRKYRSRALSELVGQEHITETLARAIKAGHISHAYLFTGPHGTGKTSVARILAHEINGLPYADTPHLDIIEIDAASNRRIDDIRELREKVHIAPISAKYKVYIIDEVHMLTGESFNALLKTLEEPPAHVVFILATTEVHKLPATIISRTQRFAFRPGAKAAVTAHLKMIAGKEGAHIDDDALALIAEHGAGSFRDSVSLLDQLMHISAGNITAADVAASLGLAPKELIQALVSALKTGDTSKVLPLLSELEQQGANAAAIVDQLTKALLAESGAQPHFLALIDKLLDVPRSYNPHLKLIATLSMPTGAPIAAPQKNAATLATITPPITVAQAAPKEIAKPTPEPAAEPPKTIPTEPLQTMESADWGSVLAAMKQKSPPIYSVLKQAQPIMKDGALVLTFKYALHSKKLDDVKQKALVVAVVQETLGKTPEVKVAVDKSATPPIIPDDPRVAGVTAIMGGGEVINAQTI